MTSLRNAFRAPRSCRFAACDFIGRHGNRTGLWCSLNRVRFGGRDRLGDGPRRGDGMHAPADENSSANQSDDKCQSKRSTTTHETLPELPQVAKMQSLPEIIISLEQFFDSYPLKRCKGK